MPAYIVERWDSREGTVEATGQGSTRTLRLFVAGTYDDAEVHQLCRDELPAYHDTYYPFRSYRVEPKGGGLWHVEADYGYGGKLTKVVFSTKGGTEHVTQSLATVRRYALGSANANAAVPDYKGAIGVNDDSVQGVDIPVAGVTWSETHHMPLSLIIQPLYLATLSALTTRVNALSFREFPRGSVRFDGADGEYEAPEGEVDPLLLVPVTYSFSASDNRSDILPGGVTQVYEGSAEGGSGSGSGSGGGALVAGIVKEGWQYLWVAFKETTSRNKLVRQPDFAYVEQVYRYGDFSLLGIGT